MLNFGQLIRFNGRLNLNIIAGFAMLASLLGLPYAPKLFAQTASSNVRLIKTQDVPEPSGGSILGTQPSYKSEYIHLLNDSLSPASAEPIDPYAPPVDASIEGINFDENAANTGFYQIPPDPHGAAGPSHLVSVVNSSIEWFTKAGATQNSQSLASFFAALSPLTLTFDPKVIYDQYAGRFVVVTLERTDTFNGDPANTSRILVAVSDDGDPNGTWYFHAIDSKVSISSTDYWADYPGLGVDEEAIYVTNNLFTFGASSSYGGARLWIIHKTPFYSGGAATVSIHDPSGEVGQAATTAQPAHAFGTVPATVGTFLVRYSGYSDGTNEYLSIIRVDNPLTAPAFTHQFVALGNIDNTAAAMPDAPQLGSAILIETNDRRALNAVWRSDGLWVAMTVVPPAGTDAGQATAHWVKVNTSSLAALVMEDQGDVGGEDIATGAYTFFPSVTVSASGNMGIGFALSSPTTYPGAYFTARLASDPASTVQSTGTLRPGLDYYYRAFGGSRNRWGDYSGMSIDPADDARFWVFNEYARTRGTVLGGLPAEDGRWGTAFGSFDFVTAPAQEWVTRFNGPGNAADEARAITVDNLGNVYVTGYSIGSGGSKDYVTVKYNSAGVKQWVARYNGPSNQDDEAYALAVDASGNVFVTGYSTSAGGYYDYATVKYNSSGVRQWVARYNGPGDSTDVAHALAIDGAGNVYVTGLSFGSSNKSDYATIKYNSAGAKQWAARYNGPGNSTDEAHALAVDGSGNVYVTGWSSGTSSSTDYATIKYNSAGVKQWAARYNGPGNNIDEGHALAVDGSGNIYVTGSSRGTSGFDDYATIKYNGAGVKQWVARYNGPANNHDLATALAIDGSNVYVTGFSMGASGNNDYATIKYNGSGVQQWVARYNGPGNNDDRANALAIDGSGNIFVTGYSTGTGGSYDYATVMYTNTGIKQWVTRYNGPANNNDRANALALDGSGNIYVTGFSYAANGTPDYATIKYSGYGTAAPLVETTDGDDRALERTDSDGDQTALDTGAKLPATFDLAQNFPNPFNPTTTIRFEVPKSSKVKLAVYNLRGELVRTLVLGELAAGYHYATLDASGLASGIYFYRLEAGAFIATRKLVLQK